MTQAITARLAALGDPITFAALPDEIAEVARHCVLDWLACTIAGAAEPLATILRAEVVASDTSSDATIVGTGERASALTAALVNGATSHALDFDDTHEALLGHPTVPVLPALAALAEREGRNGADLLAALVAGIEVECRLGALLGTAHYAQGWHNTATLGTFGAAAACAHMLGLDAVQTRHALGLAGTQAGGLKSGFGTMAKALHAGKAAQNGLLSALLARGGYTANPDIVETAQGFAACLAAGVVLDPAVLDGWEGRWMTRDVLFKYHAACYLTHAPINAVSELRAELAGGGAEEVEAIEIRIEPAALRVCNIAEPQTGLEGKFSLRATAAMTLLGHDMADLATYSDERVTEGSVVAVRDRVTVIGDERVPFMQASVAMRLRDGRSLRAEADCSVAAPDLAGQWDALVRKFVALVGPVLGRERADELVECVRGLHGLDDVGTLLRLTVP